MPYPFYKVLHLFGVFMVLLPLGAVVLHAMNAGTKEFSGRRLIGITHGIGLFVSLVGGFGLLARLGTGMAPWVYVKLAIWLVFGALLGVLYRKPQIASKLWFVILVLAGFAAFVAQYKPF